MKVLHIVPEINEANGVYQVARMLARESGGEVIDARQFQSTNLNNRTIEQFSEVWVHGMWLPREWKACWLALRFGKRLVRLTHGSLSPIYLEKQGKWKKRLVAPIERWLFRRTDRVVVTCEAEKKWCQEWGLRNEFEVVNLKRFFDLNGRGRISTDRKVAREAMRGVLSPPQRPQSETAFVHRCGALWITHRSSDPLRGGLRAADTPAVMYAS